MRATCAASLSVVEEKQRSGDHVARAHLDLCRATRSSVKAHVDVVAVVGASECSRFLLSADGLNVKRSSFVCALLATLPKVTVVSRGPIELELR
jgi:hypothetical protein